MFKNSIHYAQHKLANFVGKLSPSSKFIGPPKGFYEDIDDCLKNYPKAGFKKLLLYENLPDKQHSFNKYHVAIRNGRINLNPWSFITADDRLLFRESSCYGPQPKEHWVFRSFKLPKPKKLHGKSLFLSSRNNYWHLLADELCDISLITESGTKLCEFDQIIFEKPSYTAAQELHKIFRLDKVKQVSLLQNLHFECEELHFFTGTFSLSKYALTSVKERILNSLCLSNEDSKKKNNKIIISRGSSTTRRWLNEEECVNQLNTLGFKQIDPSNMSLSEQINAFSSAEVILGPHGAGLTNLMFSRPGSKVIEIRSNEQCGEYSSATCYEELSKIIGLEHHIFMCPTIERKDLKGRSIEDADLVPNPKKLRNFLCKLILP